MSNNSKIKSFADACKYLKRDPKRMPKVSHLTKKEQAQVIAAWQVPIIIEAINKEANGGKKWVANYKSGNTQYKYWIWWVWKKDGKGSGFRFDAALHGWAVANSSVGPRLSFATREAAIYFGSVPAFVKLYNQMVKQ